MKYIEHTIIEHLCEDCEIPLGDHEGDPCVVDENETYYCHDCALKKGLIDADDWLHIHGIRMYDHAIYKDGYIIAYRKWGKSYRKDVVRIFEDENI